VKLSKITFSHLLVINSVHSNSGVNFYRASYASTVLAVWGGV